MALTANTNIITQEIINHFTFGDWHLGFRRFLDMIIATNDSNIYQIGLDACDAYDKIVDQKDTNPAAWQAVIMPVLNAIDQKEAKIASPNYVSLNAQNISKKYKKGSFGLKPLSLILNTGQITGLVGENGNGKTTLFKVLFGTLKQETGKVNYFFSDADKGQSYNYEVKTKLAFIEQRPEPLYGPLSDNIQFAASHAGIFGKENYLWTQLILARMGLRQFRNYNWKQISSGYKMRFELAMALVRKPNILMLDEPLANLDILAQQIILEDLKYLAKSQTMPMSIILSSQQLYEVEKVAHQIVFLKNGLATISNNEKLIPNSLDMTNDQVETVVELETTLQREDLWNLFKPIGIKKISYNGGIYLVYFNANTNMTQILESLAISKAPVNYLRDISNSARRFFDA